MTDHVTVLVVDDELPICKFVRDVLLSAGYAVLTASNGEDALRIFREQSGRIGCVMTDYQMPGMNGRQLAEHLLRLQPGLQVIFISGAELDLAGYPVLKKPLTSAQVSESVRNLLAAIPPHVQTSVRQSKSAVEQERRLRGAHTTRHDRRGGNPLTRREEELLVLIAGGYSTREAAHQLGITFKTAACHRAHIYNKLDVHGIAGLLRYAVRNGMIAV